MIKKLRLKNVISLVGWSLSLLLILTMALPANAQNVQIRGRVTSADDGTALPGVTVKVKGETKGTITDINGGYSLSVPTGSVLVFSFTGFSTQQITVGDNHTINVRLVSENRALQEVNVVAIGYGTSTRKDLTGSVSSVTAKQIEEVPVTTVDQALQGRAAGVQVTNNDAAPGGNVSVMIRGVGSLASGGNDPLYVVDGYPISGGLNNINPNDIASIDILKDASATAIYGIRAANGVVIVTTKKGRKDGVQVSLDAYDAFQTRPKEYKLLNAQQFATLALDVAANDPTQHFTVLPNWNTPSSLTTVNWQNAIYRPGLTQNYNIGIRGGSDKTQTATSIGYYDQKGIVLGSFFKRLSLSNNTDYQPFKWLHSSTNFKYSYQNSNNPYSTGSTALGNIPQLPPTLDGGSNITNLISDGKGNYGFFNPIYTYVAKYGNPIYSISTNQYKNITNYILAGSSLDATIIEGLKITTHAGINYTGYSGSYFQPEDDRLVNQYGAQAGSSANALYTQHINSTFDWLWENTLSYDRTFGKHTINFVGGVSEQQTTWNGMGGSVIPPNSVIRDLNQGTNLKLDPFVPGTYSGNGQIITALASQFGRLTYKFEDKYLITGTIRRDGSSKFDVGHQYGIFPTGAVAWRVKQESFLKNTDWLSDLKIRGSYGKVGNQGSIPPFQYQALYSTGAPAANSGNLGYPFGKIGGSNGTYYAGIAEVQPENPNLRWETDYMTDIGLDAAFLHGDLTLTADWFNRKSQDFLLNISVSPQTGYTSESKNVGSMNNRGFELALNYSHTINNGFHYNLGLTFSALQNRLTSLFSGAKFITNFGGVTLPGNGWTTFTETHIGQPVGEFYGYKTNGIFQNQAQIDALNNAAKAKGFAAYQAGVFPGDRYFADTNGDGTITPDDQVSLGSPQPKFFGGFNFEASYKSFDINAYFYGVYGNKLLNYEESNLESFQNRSFVGVENVSQEFYQNRWTPSNPSNRYARASYNDDVIGNLQPSDVWVENGSFLKLKTLTIGYTLPQATTRKIAMSRVRIYVSSQNLFTITSYKGLDPEIGIQNGNATQTGVDNGTYPSSRYYTVGLNVTF